MINIKFRARYIFVDQSENAWVYFNLFGHTKICYDDGTIDNSVYQPNDINDINEKTFGRYTES